MTLMIMHIGYKVRHVNLVEDFLMAVTDKRYGFSG